MSSIKTFYQKPLVKETTFLIINSILAGFILSMAAVASIFAPYIESTRLAKGFMFSFGLLVIILFELKLFTGMIANAPYTPAKKWWTLGVCLVFNAVGGFIGASIARGAFGSKVIDSAATTLGDKLIASGVDISAGSMFLSAVLCGMCMTIAVLGCRAAKEKNFSATFLVVLPVMVFILCGFEHSIANLIYVFLAGAAWTGKVWLLIGMSVLRNLVGGIIIPVCKLLENKRYLAETPQNQTKEESTTPAEKPQSITEEKTNKPKKK